jgi:hypothetical protein
MFQAYAIIPVLTAVQEGHNYRKATKIFFLNVKSLIEDGDKSL